MRSASREPIEGEAALSVLEGIDELVVAQGRKVERFDLTSARPSDEELLGLLLGRSGKLRAPTLRSGRRLVVGFNGEVLEEALAE